VIGEPDPKWVFTAGDAYHLVCAHVRALLRDGMATLSESAGRSDGPAGGGSGKGMRGEQQLGGGESAADRRRDRPAAERVDHEACGSCGTGDRSVAASGAGRARQYSICCRVWARRTRTARGHLSNAEVASGEPYENKALGVMSWTRASRSRRARRRTPPARGGPCVGRSTGLDQLSSACGGEFIVFTLDSSREDGVWMGGHTDVCAVRAQGAADRAARTRPAPSASAGGSSPDRRVSPCRFRPFSSPEAGTDTGE
jgi:hypothetical protein